MGVHVAAAVAAGREVAEGEEVEKTKGVRNEKEEVPAGDLEE